jgi:prepilin-type N-terminal cleavage/methylation domain-containing protein
MNPRGYTLVESLVVIAVMLTAAAIGFPVVRARFADAHILGAARQFKSQFRLAAAEAVRGNVYTAIRFERLDDGDVRYAVYRDGDEDGVRSADIDDGVDALVSGPFPLTAGAPGVHVGFNPGTPAVPPERGTLSGDPIRFGRSDILSFSPFGTATPGTFYLAGDAACAAVRVTGGSARVRTMLWRGGRWVER